MDWLTEHWMAMLFLSLYLLVLAHHAWKGQQQVKSLSDYLVAGRQLGGWVVALSFYATFMSTNTFIGAAGKSWDVGLIWCLGIFVYVGLCGLSWFVVAPRFVPLTRQYDSLTVADFLGHHYQSTSLRRSAGLIILVASIIYLVAIYQGSALALAIFLDLDYQLCVLLVFLVVTGYTLAGGFQSVVLTDALQGSLMVIGAVGMFIALLNKGGGLGKMLEQVQQQDSALVSWQGNLPLLAVLGYALAVGIKYVVEPRQLSRFYGLKNKQAMRTAAWVAPLLITITYISLLPVGTLARAVVPVEAIGPGETDLVVPYLLGTTKIFGPLVSTMFLLVLISAAMSSIDSVLLVAASAVDHDLLSAARSQDNEARLQRAVRRTRIWVVLISAVTMLISISPLQKDIVTLTSLSGSLYGACFLPALVVGMFWKRATAVASLVSCGVGAFTVIGWFTAKRLGYTELHEIYVGLAVGLGTFVLLSFLGVGPPRVASTPVDNLQSD
jgi:SSS family transporter